MPSCEKCWRDSARGPYSDHATDYAELIEYRDRYEMTCTPEEQAGEDATHCPTCQRRTVHQYARICLLCGFSRGKEFPF